MSNDRNDKTTNDKATETSRVGTGFMRISPINIGLVALSAAGAVATGLAANWLAMALLIALGLGIAVLARAASHPDAPTELRVGSFQYRDERDRELARRGLSTVGAVAMVLVVLEAIAAIIFAPDWLVSIATVQLVAFSLLWQWSNRRAIGRE